MARAAFVANEDGVILAADADPETPLERLGQTAVESIGGVTGLARLVDTPGFGVVFHEVAGENLYVSVLSESRTLGVMFDQDRTSLGAVRLRVKAAREDLLHAIEGL